MRTLLFAPCIVDTEERLQRNIKWLRYYAPLKDKLGYDRILLVDNASPPEFLSRLEKEIETLGIDARISKKKIRLERIKTDAYGYWYRAFGDAAYYALDHGFDKLIHIDTDVFVFTDKICEYIKNQHYLDSPGWIGFWCDIHKYNETIFQVCTGRDNLDNMYQFMTEGFLQYYPFDIAERKVPFTHIEKNFTGDRYPERGKIVQEEKWDWCGQCPVSMKVTFKGTL